MRIGIIGAGNVATHLANAFFSKGIEIVCVISKKQENAIALGSKVNALAFSNMKKFKKWNQLDFVIIAVKDDAIPEVLASNLLKNCNVLHTSGSFDSSLMKDYCTNYGAIYPFQTFRKNGTVKMDEVPFFIEYNDPAGIPQIENLVKLISTKVFQITSEERKKLHVSGVFINNFIYFILNQMKGYSKKQGIDINHLMPLLHQTIDNALNYSENMQTGPAVRGDKKTLNSHLDLLGNEKILTRLYTTISEMIFESENGKEIKL